MNKYSYNDMWLLTGEGGLSLDGLKLVFEPQIWTQLNFELN